MTKQILNKNIYSYDENGKRHGYWETFWSNTHNYYYNGNYYRNKRKGLWKWYHYDGEIKSQVYYL